MLSPDPAQVKNKDWYRALSGRAAAVYDHHGIIWRSAKVLFDHGAIDTPGGVRGLIERVYAPPGSTTCLSHYVPSLIARKVREARHVRTHEPTS